MSDKLGVYHPTGTYMYRAHLAMYAHVQSKQVRLLTKGHVCVYVRKVHIFLTKHFRCTWHAGHMDSMRHNHIALDLHWNNHSNESLPTNHCSAPAFIIHCC